MTATGAGSGIAGRLARGTAWLAGARLVMNALALAGTLVLARLLTPDDFGLVALATTVFTLVQSLTELSLSQALVQHRAPEPAHYHAAFTLNLLRAALVAGVVAAVAGPAADLYGDPRLTPLILVVSASTVLTGLTNPKLATFSRDLVFRQEFYVGIANRLTALVLSVAVALATGSYWALVAGTVGGQLVALVVSYALLPHRPRLALGKARELMGFSVWVTLSKAVQIVNWRFDHLAIGYALGTATLGAYTVGDRLAALPTREATTPLMQAVFPGFTHLVGDRDRLRAAYQRAQRTLTAVALPTGVLLACLADPAVRLLLGPHWATAATVVQFLAAIFAVQTLATTVTPLAMALGETRRLFVRDTAALLVRIPLLVVGLLAGGLVGVLAARCLSGTIGMLMNLALARRLLGLPIRAQLAANLRSILSLVPMLAAVAAVQHVVPDGDGSLALLAGMAATSVAAGCVYLLSTFALWWLGGKRDGPEKDIILTIQNLPRRGGDRKLLAA